MNTLTESLDISLRVIEPERFLFRKYFCQPWISLKIFVLQDKQVLGGRAKALGDQ